MITAYQNPLDAAASSNHLARRHLLAWGAALLGPWVWPARAESAPVIEVIELPGARIELQLPAGFSASLQAQTLAWVRRSAEAVTGYFGRFPVPRVELLVMSFDGAGVRGGTTYADPSLFVRVALGAETSRAQFLSDWVMVHEMTHLAIPRVPRSQNWLHEGIATYVEGVARSRAGLLPAAEVWGEWSRGMVHGLPQDGDRGLDHTPTWGRTYWGGALFCLLGDVKIRQRSARRLGLQQALQGVLAAGGSYQVAWPVARILAAADAAVGQTTLTELYGQMKDTPVPTDLPALWRDLGVGPGGLNDDAPLAAERRAILA